MGQDQPSDTWEELVRTYASYRALPVWGPMVRVPEADGRLRKVHVKAIAARGARAALRVEKAIAKFRQRAGADWPASPKRLIGNQVLFDRLRVHARPGLDLLRSFWEALIFDRDFYTCAYCGRNAFRFYISGGKRRSIWLVVDRRNAIAKAKGVFDFTNGVAACWSCNTLKGALPEPAFLAELDSLLEARLLGQSAGRVENRRGDW
jgi:hypothetical protein